MKVKLKNGTMVGCSNPIEQKIFKGGESAGWVCSLTFTDNLNSTEIDNLVTSENMSEMTFVNDENETVVTCKSLRCSALRPVCRLRQPGGRLYSHR